MKIAPIGPAFELCQAIENSSLGVWLRGSIMAIPIADAMHVIAIAFVLGTILIVDIRLLGLPSTRWPITLLSHPLIRCTWLAFVIAAITGTLIFVANATTYYINLAFRIKMILILMAGINMMVFEFITVKTLEKWDQEVQPPLAAKTAAFASLTLWIGVLVLGRITGYTKEAPFAVTVPDTLDLNTLHFK